MIKGDVKDCTEIRDKFLNKWKFEVDLKLV